MKEVAATLTDESKDSLILPLLRVCAKRKDVYRGTKVHADVLKSGLLEKSSYVANSLVSMYAKCGALKKAKEVLEELPFRDVCTWNALIAGYVQQGQAEEAFTLYEQMQCEGIPPNAATFTSISKACGRMGASDKGEQVYDEVVRQGLLRKDIVLGTALVDMYAKFGAASKAQQVLDELPARDVISWTAVIAGYAQQGLGKEALNCLKKMQSEGISPNVVTLTCALKACGSIRAAEKGAQIHDMIIAKGLLGNNLVLGTALMDMYVKCGALMKAQEVLDELPVRDVICWNALIAGFAEQEQGESALNSLELMQGEGLSPNTVTYICALKACGTIGAAGKGEQIHGEIATRGLLRSNVVLGTAVVDMYVKCGELAKAHQVLEELPLGDAVSWSALIVGYAQQNQGEEALKCFEQMQEKGLPPDEVTFACILKACGSIGSVDKGEKVYEELCRQGLLEDNIPLGTALVDMYTKCGALVEAQRVLEHLELEIVILWNGVIAGYIENGQDEEALTCFESMQNNGLLPDEVTFMWILKASGNIGAADKGENFHDEIVKQGLLGSYSQLATTVGDMYVKCGAFAKAQEVLEELWFEDVVSWSALIAGFAHQGQSEKALNFFEQMKCMGLSPDPVSFSSVLHTCSHSGLVHEGLSYYASMTTNYGIVPNLEHYTCLVDLFGRAGQFENAIALIQRLRCSGCVTVWSNLLGACQKWHNVDIGRFAFEKAIRVDKQHAAAYVYMSNILAAAGLQADAEHMEMRKSST